MQWKSRGFKSIPEIINENTGGNADRMLMGSNSCDYNIANLPEMAAAINYIVEQNMPIYIIGDYDVDGIHATAELFLLLRELGAVNIHIRLPRRMSEGYGLSPKIVDEIPDGHGAVITVDNGITAVEAIKKAKAKGLIVLVIDHHMPLIGKAGKEEIPEADLIVDPAVDDILIAKKYSKSDFRKYCGAGLVYKIAERMVPGTSLLGTLSVFAAIATIADVVPLVEDNRNIYRMGIENIFNGNITPGLAALIRQLQSGGKVNESDIGFKIAPMINAPGRIYDDGAQIALEAVLAGTDSQAYVLTEELKDINEKRKILKEEAVKRAMDYIKDNCLFAENPIVIFDPETPEGIVGLVAGAIQKEFNVTAIALTESGEYMKGSARAAEGDNIKEALDAFNRAYPGVILKYGGHPKAAGLTLKKESFDIFLDGMRNIMPPVKEREDILFYDMEIEAGQISRIVSQVRQYAPFGEGNPEPVFLIKNFKLVPQENTFFKEMGKDSIRFRGAGCEAVGFSLAQKYQDEKCPKEMDIVGKLSYHHFMGKTCPQIEMMDFKSAKGETVKLGINIDIMNQLKKFNLG